jgi:CspA family cold shock protein
MVECVVNVDGPCGALRLSRTTCHQPADQFEKEEREMTTGTIKKLVADRGFGFITAEDGKEYFFHRSSIESFDSLRGTERVEFDVEDSPKGPRAAQVRVSQGAPEAAPAAAPQEATETADEEAGVEAEPSDVQ